MAPNKYAKGKVLIAEIQAFSSSATDANLTNFDIVATLLL